MELEQEIASIIKYLLDATGNPSPYYYSVPQSFVVPAAYFPTPEIDTDGDTLNTYGMDYVMYVKFFAKSTREAYNYGVTALTKTRGRRNLIPLINEMGNDTGKGMRIYDPDLKMLDDGAAQLTIAWRSRRPYDRREYAEVRSVNLSLQGKQYEEKIVDEAMENAISSYLIGG